MVPGILAATVSDIDYNLQYAAPDDYYILGAALHNTSVLFHYYNYYFMYIDIYILHDLAVVAHYYSPILQIVQTSTKRHSTNMYITQQIVFSSNFSSSVLWVAC